METWQNACTLKKKTDNEAFALECSIAALPKRKATILLEHSARHYAFLFLFSFPFFGEKREVSEADQTTGGSFLADL